MSTSSATTGTGSRLQRRVPASRHGRHARVPLPRRMAKELLEALVANECRGGRTCLVTRPLGVRDLPSASLCSAMHSDVVTGDFDGQVALGGLGTPSEPHDSG